VRSRGTKLASLVVLATLSLAGVAAQPALARIPAPTELRVLPREEALLVRWHVSSSEDLAGFRVRYRPVSSVARPWSAAIKRPASARAATIAGLVVKRYEVRVRAVLSEGRIGGMATAIGKPLPREAEEKEEEEPPQEEPPQEEPPLEEPPLEGTVPLAPLGLPVPVGGWQVVFADAFAAPLGIDTFWELPSKNNGCCSNSDEIAIERPSQDRITPEGLKLVCEYLSTPVEGRHYSCGGIRTPTSRFSIRAYSGATYALEVVCKWPPNTNEADPGVWIDGSESPFGEQEIDAPFEGFGWHDNGSHEYGAVMPQVVHGWGHTIFSDEGVVKALGFDPTRGFHRYTTLIKPGASGKTKLATYVDGVFKWSGETTTPGGAVWQHAILTYALRSSGAPSGFKSGSRAFTIRSDAFYASVGAPVQGGGIAPGTLLAP
jgi:hypothetical protein